MLTRHESYLDDLDPETLIWVDYTDEPTFVFYDEWELWTFRALGRRVELGPLDEWLVTDDLGTIHVLPTKHAPADMGAIDGKVYKGYVYCCE